MSEHSPEDMTFDPLLDVQKEYPPNTPPSPDMTESDLKLSRKREREVSLEPATPKAISIDIDPGLQESKESRTPAKKNRLHLDATAEEDDDGSGSRTPSHSPPLSTSPPHEIKVRQISQGVEHLTWQNRMKASVQENEGEDSLRTDMEQARPPVLDDSLHGAVETAATSQEDENQNDSSLLLDEFPSSSHPRHDSDTDCAEKDKGLKRKLGDRATSQGPQDFSQIVQGGTDPEPLKRHRDDANIDNNPREAKRSSPPPESDSEPKKTPALKSSGFMAYASSSSPFASVKGANIFSTPNKISQASSAFSISPPPSPSKFISPNGESSMSASNSEAVPTSAKRTGFEAFAGSTSPFASATRSKSPSFSSGSGLKLNRNRSPPRRTNAASLSAFSSYACGGIQGFAVPVPKRARAGSPSGGSSRSSMERNSTTVNVLGSSGPDSSGGDDDDDDKPASFGEKLRASIDDEDEYRSDEDKGKVPLTELETTTGEEDEDTLHQVRGKLFSLSSQNQWKERGTGTLKLNVRRSDGGGARLVMRKEAVYTLLVNVTLFSGMRCFVAQDPRYLRFSVIERGITTHYNLRVSSAKVAQELLEEINANIPTAS